MIRTNEQGFSAVELLITLFVAIAFLVAGYQLFDIVIRNGGEARSESQAANTAYSYLRRYSENATNPCTTSTPLSSSPVTVSGLSDVTMSIFITCPQQDAAAISKIEALISYGTPAKQLRYATFVDKSRSAAASTEVTAGLVNHWPLNGSGSPSAGAITLGAINGASPANNVYGQANTAYSFSTLGAYQYLNADQSPIVSTSSVTIALWVYTASGTNSGSFLKIGSSGNGYGIGMGNTSYANTSPGTQLFVYFDGVRWINTSTAVGTGWHHIALSLDSSGVPSVYRDGVLLGSYSGASAIAPSGGMTAGGSSTAHRFSGSVDDIRVYNRTLTSGEVLQMYQAGPK